MHKQYTSVCAVTSTCAPSDGGPNGSTLVCCFPCVRESGPLHGDVRHFDPGCHLILSSAVCQRVLTQERLHRRANLSLDDLVATKSVVGIVPKPAFYPLFESMLDDKGTGVRVFKPNLGTMKTLRSMEAEGMGRVTF